MILVDTALTKRQEANNPIRVGLVGAGYMGRGIALQILTAVPGMELVAVANRHLAEARRAYAQCGVTEVTAVETTAQLETTIEQQKYAITEDALLLATCDRIDTIIENESAAETLAQKFGINTAIITQSGRYEGYSFAVPSNLAKKVVKDLKEYGIVQRGVLGVFIDDVNHEIAEELGLPSVEGVFVTRVTPGSGADEAGMTKGDVIVSINGIKTRSLPEMQEQLGRYRPGITVQVEFYRSGNYLSK